MNFKTFIKSFAITFYSLLVSTLSFAQSDPTPVKPPAYTSYLNNFVRTWDVQIPITDPNAITTGSLREVKQSTQYADGLGRPLQTVVKQGSYPTNGSATDMVVAKVYDEFGRDLRSYLPYASTENNGTFKLDPFEQQKNFYGVQLTGQNETYYYSKTDFEPSPLNRVSKTMAPGNSWIGSSKGIEMKYWINTLADDVKQWNVTDVGMGSFGTYGVTGVYPAGRLYKNATVDENNKQVIEFKDKEGKVILKKVQLTAVADDGTGRDHSGWLCTYYIYDDLTQLRAVIQPRAVELLPTNWQLTTDILNELTFRYEYDQRGRMVNKKVPGAAEVYMVYDARDRLVMTQDGNMRSSAKWLCTTYDGLNRPVSTGIINDNNGLSYHLGQAYNSTSYPNTLGYDLLTETHYDNYDNLPSGLSSSLDNSYSGSVITTYNASPDYAQEVKKGITTIGVSTTIGTVTWSRVKILGASQYLASVNIYDESGRLVQVQSINQTGGTDIATTQYDFAGKVLRTHIKLQKSGASAIEIATKNNYDDLGRITRIEKQINNSGWKAISQVTYDALGQPKTKTLSPDYNGLGLETLTYDYNIRGWMLGANRDYAKTPGSTTNYFGFDLGYDKQTIASLGSYAAAQLNGNITGTVWKSKGDNEVRKYDFTYDAVNRLTGADFNQYTGGFNRNAGVNFSVSNLTYDANGNIKTMDQVGLKLNSSAQIDNLTYHYLNNDNSNKLQYVSDGISDNKLGDFTDKNTSTADYGYDVNGNMVTDLNKRLNGATGADLTSGGAITYNYLNLPQSIAVKDDNGNYKGTITYTYDAAGNKLKKEVAETGQPLKTTLYLGGAVYENDVLQFIGHEEGRIRYKPTDASFQYDYFLKDHLGNVRMVLTEEQQQDAYPVASLENAPLNNEKNYYSIPDNTSVRVNKNYVDDYPTDGYTSPNDYVHKLNGNGTKIGSGIVLKVMSGDKVNIRANSWYKTYSSNPASPVNPLYDLIIALANGIAGSSAGKLTSVQLQQSGALTPGIGDFLTDQSNGTNGSKPKAYLSFVLYDEKFKPVITYDGKNTGFDQVGDNDEFKTHSITGREITKNGYLYIYLSNETPNIDVFFDNLQVTHVRGQILEETHYYPFGLTMAGISSEAAKGTDYPENKKGFNGNELQSKEFSDLSGLAWYDFNARTYDPQTGRFIQIDPTPEDGDQESLTPYHFTGNNPIRFDDPNGQCGWCKEMWNELTEAVNTTASQLGLPTVYNDAVKGARVFNTYVNPLATAVEVITGKSSESDFTEAKPRSVSAAELAIVFIPGAKVEGAIVKTVEHAIEKQAEKAVETQLVHGNSKASTKLTNLYKLETKEGKYLKTGVTSKLNPEKRYTNTFMKDKKMTILDQGSRAEMLKKERKIVEKTPGPLNKEKWAGKNKDQ